MNKIALAVLVTSLTLAPVVPAQTCSPVALFSCVDFVRGIDSPFAVAIAAYCALSRAILCDTGF